uniref:Subtilisin-like protease n=1 Tax=Aegilops tauschii TaxID=37682 RepID=M8BL52_AEGTA
METTRLSLLSLLPFLLLATAAAATGGELSTFIFHVQAEENRVFGTADDRKAWYHSFLPDHGRLVHAYHHVASGFAARLTWQELEAVSPMPGFLSATRARTYTTLTTHTPEFLGLNVEQGRRNYTSEFGAGVIVGLIDTGIFPDHPSFSDDGMPPPPAKWKGRCDFSCTSCNNKLIGARNFVAAFNGPNGTSARVPPVDEFGHWTHTASTAAGAVVPGANVLGNAWGTAAGMAVRAHIAMYKVCYGKVVIGCEDADILAGIDAAVGDGCDVISISLGGPSVPFHLDPMAIGTFGAIEKGIFLGNGAYFHGESLYQLDAGFYPLVYAGASGMPFAEFCGNGSLDGFDVKGKIVLCELTRNITVINQGEVVESADGVGMILANPFSRGYDKLAQANVLPASSVDYYAGAAIKLYLNSTANPVVHIGFRGTVLGTSPGPSIVFFSSRGPSRQGTGVLKPDITGPGVNVLAAWPFQVGPPSAPVLPGPTFNIISGTSMSTPHLAGIAALIKSKHPDRSPMLTPADITDRSGSPILNEQRVTANLFATGAGHVNPMKVADPGIVYDITPEDYIGYLCSMYTSKQLSVIARRPIDCLTTVMISDRLLNYPSISVAFPESWNSTAPVVVRRKVKNVGEVPSVYYAAIDMPSSAVSVDVYPRELEFIKANQEVIFSVYVWPRQSGARVVQGDLRWVSEKHTVRSPISVTFA